MADDCPAKAPDFWRCHRNRISALVELGRVREMQDEALRLLRQMPRMTAGQFRNDLADSAGEMRQRRIAAARWAGLP